MQIFDILSDFLKNKIVYSYWIFRMSKFSPFPSSSPQKAKINIIFLDWMLNYFFKNKLLKKKNLPFFFLVVYSLHGFCLSIKDNMKLWCFMLQIINWHAFLSARLYLFLFLIFSSNNQHARLLSNASTSVTTQLV